MTMQSGTGVQRVEAPSGVRVVLGRAAVQLIADDAGAQLLHIKGEAVDSRLSPRQAPGSDVDALVRPAHVSRLDTALRARGWRIHSTFANGSPFEHAQTYLHDLWGYFDLHRWFPGINLPADEAFELLWKERQPRQLAGATGSVPSLPMQATILILNAARSGVGDPVQRWIVEPGIDPAVIERCVGQLQAQVAYAAATGHLADFSREPDYTLWSAVTQDGSRTAEWLGRYRAAHSWRQRIRIIARAPRVNIDDLSHRLGRQPTRSEIVAETIRRASKAGQESWTWWRGRSRRG